MYKHLTEQQRYQISSYLQNRCTQKQIAELLGVHPSTISREIRRNAVGKDYDGTAAHSTAVTRKSEAASNNAYHCDESLRAVCLNLIVEKKWSPAQIAGSMKAGTFESETKGTVSAETIYKWVREDQEAGGKVFKSLRRRQKKYQRRIKPNAGRGYIPDRVDIDERPQEVNERQKPGHWEADTVIGTQRKGEVLVTLVERSSRKVLAKKVKNKSAEAVTAAIIELLGPYQELVHSITFDNGKEFAGHKQISQALKCDCYFAKPYHSWERGSNERTNGLIRQYCKKGHHFEFYSNSYIQNAIDAINGRPMKLLGFRSPNSVFQSFLDSATS